jgi:hypothetical protein
LSAAPGGRADRSAAEWSPPRWYTEAQALLDEDYADGWRYYWKSIHVPELSDELIERVAEHAAATPSPHSTIDVWYQGGAMARVGEEETAFANRSEPYLLGIEATWEEEPSSQEIVAWVREVFAELRSFSGRRIYLNFPRLLEEGKQLLCEGYGRNYERLVEVKTKHHPTNLFRATRTSSREAEQARPFMVEAAFWRRPRRSWTWASTHAQGTSTSGPSRSARDRTSC